jgi:hypothetical protein
MDIQPTIDACVDELMRHAINDCDVTDLVTDALSQLLESVREAIIQEFVALLESYGLEPTSDLSQQLDEYLNDHPHIAVDMVAVQMQAALAVVRCQPVEPYTAPADEPSMVALAEVEQLRAKLLAKRHALYADNLPNAIADA